jgi:hypothetical protein
MLFSKRQPQEKNKRDNKTERTELRAIQIKIEKVTPQAARQLRARSSPKVRRM